MFVYCCGETVCRDCIVQKMIKNPPIKVADPVFIVKGEFDCAFCKSDHNAPPGVSLSPLPLQVNRMVFSIIEKQDREPVIYCDEHQDTKVTHFCLRDRKLVCSYCRDVYHGEHKDKTFFICLSRIVEELSKDCREGLRDDPDDEKLKNLQTILKGHKPVIAQDFFNLIFGLVALHLYDGDMSKIQDNHLEFFYMP